MVFKIVGLTGLLFFYLAFRNGFLVIKYFTFDFNGFIKTEHKAKGHVLNLYIHSLLYLAIGFVCILIMYLTKG